MKIQIMFPVLPPVLDGIGDHTAHLAGALAAKDCQVEVLTAQEEWDAIPGVTVERIPMKSPRVVRRLVEVVARDQPDWLFIQFNQFSYGRWGLNPYLPLAVFRLKRACPEIRVAWMAHEDFVPATSWRFAAMALWQRTQFWLLGRSADLVLFSVSPWVEEYRSWFPKAPIRHLPVGSNIPRVEIKRAEARKRIGINDDSFVAGIFGSAHGSRLLDHVRRAAEVLQHRAGNFTVLYVGPHGEAIRSALPGCSFIDAGSLPAEEVSLRLAAMDLHLAPFMDGVSTRRGSFMAGLQHGVPTVSTRGKQTDAMLNRQNEHVFQLVDEGDIQGFAECAERFFDHPARRQQMARRSRAFYDAHFDWPCLASRLVAAMKDVDHATQPFAHSSS